MKKIIKYIINKFGYDIVSINKWELPKRPFNVLKFIVNEYLKDNRDFYFLQIGASNGVRGNDPIRALIMQYHLRGLLVEPMPDFFKELKENYKSESQLDFENCAIGPLDGEMRLFRFARDAPVPKEFFHGLARFDKEYIIRRAKANGLENYIEELKVPTLTLKSLVNKYKIKKITLLQIDTEGYDFEILKQVLSLNILPKIINYEWTEITFKERYECKKMLSDKCYSFVDVGADTICLLKP